VLALKIADTPTWTAVGSPDGTMFGSPRVPPWGLRMGIYVWRRRYDNIDNMDLRSAGKAFRVALISGQLSFVAWIAVVFLFGHGTH